MLDQNRLYRVEKLERLGEEFGGLLVLEIKSKAGKSFKASFPSGPGAFVPKTLLITWLRSSILNLECLISESEGSQG